MIDHRKWVHVSMFKYVCGKGRDAFENVPLIASQGIPACSEYLEVGGALQSHAKGTPHCLRAPLYSPFLTSRAYEWPEYNKRCFFFLFLPPSCKPFFTPLRISGNVTYVYLCECLVCEC